MKEVKKIQKEEIESLSFQMWEWILLGILILVSFWVFLMKFKLSIWVGTLSTIAVLITIIKIWIELFQSKKSETKIYKLVINEIEELEREKQISLTSPKKDLYLPSTKRAQSQTKRLTIEQLDNSKKDLIRNKKLIENLLSELHHLHSYQLEYKTKDISNSKVEDLILIYTEAIVKLKELENKELSLNDEKEILKFRFLIFSLLSQMLDDKNSKIKDSYYDIVRKTLIITEDSLNSIERLKREIND